MPDADCFTNDNDTANPSHEANSREYQSAAAAEGFAHYYAAVAFNDTTESDCGCYYYKDVNWDLDTGLDDAWGSCQDGPMTGVDCCDYYGDMCAETLSHRAVEWDYLRFFWDVDHEITGVDTTVLFDVWEGAFPGTWNPEDVNTDTNDGVDDFPEERLRESAVNEGISRTTWDSWAATNGVAR